MRIKNSRVELIMNNKTLPDFFTFNGKIFYYLSKNRYIGVSTKKMAKEFKLEILELVPILIEMYEMGLITMLQEGKTISDDIWDIDAGLRRKDPDIEKIINTTNYLEKSLNKRLKELKNMEETKEIERIKDVYELKEMRKTEENEE